MKLLEENRKHSEHIVVDDDILDDVPQVQTMKEKLETLDYIKLITLFCRGNNHFIKRNLPERDKIIA